MANDPKDDNDLENIENSEDSARAEDDSEAKESPDDAGDSDSLQDEDTDSAGIEDAEVVSETAEDVTDTEVEPAAQTDPDAGDPTPQTAPERTPPPAPAPASSTFGLVFGGLVAGAIGFLVATFAVPEGWPNPPQADNTDVAAQLATATEALTAQTSRLDALESAVTERPATTQVDVDLGPVDAALATVTGDLAAITERLAGLDETLGSADARLAALEDRVGGIDARITELESRPAVEVPDGSGAMASQLEDFRSELDTVTAAARAEIEAAQERANQIEADAAQAAATAKEQAALARISAALESGAPFQDALGDLPDAPEALSAVADDGVATLSDLASDFPAAARAALSSAEGPSVDASSGDRLGAFLRRQTNARSLSPQDGESVDAVLSRAEAAVSEGDLAKALGEIGALPEAPKSAFHGWIEKAQARQRAVDAAQSMSASVN